MFKFHLKVIDEFEKLSFYHIFHSRCKIDFTSDSWMVKNNPITISMKVHQMFHISTLYFFSNILLDFFLTWMSRHESNFSNRSRQNFHEEYTPKFNKNLDKVFLWIEIDSSCSCSLSLIMTLCR